MTAKDKGFRIRLRRGPLFRGMLMFALISALLPIAALGIGTYMYMSSVIRNEVNQSNIRVLNNAAASIDSLLARIESNSRQMLQGSFYNTDLYQLKNQDYASFYSSNFRNLSALQFSNKEMSETAIYWLEDGYMLSPNVGGWRIDDPDKKKLLDELVKTDRPYLWSNAVYPLFGQSVTPGITYAAKVPLFGDNPMALLLIHLNEQVFREMIDPYLIYPNEKSFILNESGEKIAGSGSQQAPADLFAAIGRNSGHSRFTLTFEHTDYLVTPITSQYTGWTYVDMVPLRELNAKARGIAWVTLSIVGVVLVIGLTLVLWGTNRAYRPIRGLVTHVVGDSEDNRAVDEVAAVRQRWTELKHTTTELQSRWNDQLPVLREAFALQYLQGKYLHYSDPQTRALVARYEIPADRRYSVLAVAYESEAGEEARFGGEDRELILFAIKNIMQELIEQSGYQGVTLQMPDDLTAIWLWSERDVQEREAAAGIKAIAEKMRKTLADYLRMDVTVGLGSITDNLHAVPESYDRALFAVRSRLIYGSGQVIAAAALPAAGTSHQYRYPGGLETRLEQALQLGDLEEAERALGEFAAHTRQALDKPELVRMSYHQLLGSILRTAYQIGLDSERLFGEAEADPYAELKQLGTFQEWHDWYLQRLIDPITRHVRGKQVQEAEQVISELTAYIDTHFHQDLSLDHCAELCGITPRYLSKIFKRTMKITFIEYLTGKRIDEAKRWLMESDKTVNEIAELVGYQPKNFIRVFKKHTGVTPGHYREGEKGES